VADRGYVLDACSLIATLRSEPGADRIAELLAEPGPKPLLHALNLCEVFYDALRRDAATRMEDLSAALGALGIEVVGDLDLSLVDRAARLKADRRRVSLADCVALALALERGGKLVTTDHHEFDALAAEGFPIVFAR